MAGKAPMKTFVDLLSAHQFFGACMDKKAKYEVWIAQNEFPTHWFLLIREEGHDPNRPFVTLEVKSETGDDLIPKVRSVTVNKVLLKSAFQRRPENVGIVDKTLLEICKLADTVVQEMCGYDIVKENCQDFCNRLLVELGLRTYKTTFSGTTKQLCEAAGNFIGEDFICRFG